MLFNKNKINSSVLSFALILNCFQTLAMEDSFDDLFDVTPDEQEMENLRQTRVSNCIEPQIILDTLLAINAPTLIQNSRIYCRTNTANVRSLLDLPILQPVWPDRYGGRCNALHVQAFYNQTNKAFFTKNSPFLNSYLDLSQRDLVEELSQVDFLGDVDFGRILDLFQNIKLQLRRAGVMLSYQKLFPDEAYLKIFTPFYYAESNFFLTPAEEDAIDGDPFFQQFGGQDRATVRAFLLNFVSCDKVGFGDTRVEFAGKIVDTDHTGVWLGFQSTLPTAFAIVKGILAGACSTRCPVPPFSLQELGELALCSPPNDNLPKATQIVQDFLLGVLGRLTANVGNLKLGNNGHFGIGPQLDILIEATEHINLYTRLVYELMASAHEDRFFLLKKNPEDFNRDFENEALAVDNLAFLTQQVVNTLYPVVKSVSVKPGNILKFRQSAEVNSEYWQLLLGFDYWRQGRETIKQFKNSEKYEFNRALKSSAYQGKVYMQYLYKVKGCTADGYVGIGSDITLFNRGIGKDFTVNIYLGMDF